MPERKTGTVAKWLNHKGIGFITPEGQEANDGNDILVHFAQIKQSSEDGFKSLEQGSTVEYDTEPDPKNEDKLVAVNVTGPDGEDCTAKQKGRKRQPAAEGEEEEGGERGSGKRSSGKGKGKRGKGKGKRGKGKGKGKRDDDDEAEEDAAEE